MDAPGLKYRNRGARKQAYWIPPEKDVRAGYRPKSLRLDGAPEEIAAACHKQWQDLLTWRRRERPGTVKHTIGWLIRRYQTDEISPYKAQRRNSQRSCDQSLKIIDDTVGERVIRLGPAGAPVLTGEDFRRWHHNWGRPGADGKPTAPSRARHAIIHLRALFSYAIELGVPGAPGIREILSVMKFATTKPRTVAPLRGQVAAIVEEAIRAGYVSMAATTLAQYELIERRVHILGEWEGKEWRPGWLWEDISLDWKISYFQTKCGQVRREFHLASVQPLLALLQRTPEAKRTGPVMLCETTGKPWRAKHYGDTFRKMARAAGVPDTIWSMDMRAGGATEADAVPGMTDRLLQDGGGWATSAMRDRYRRDKARNAQNVVDLRQWARGRQDRLTETPEGAGVYFMQARGGHNYIKIGFTSDVARRLTDFVTECPYTVELIGFHHGARELEQKLHDLLKAHRVKGEWFLPVPQVLQCATALPKAAAHLANAVEEREGTRNKISTDGA